MSNPVLVFEAVRRTYPEGDQELVVFDDLSTTIYGGQMVALVGPSGSGKSSLLHIAGLLETPTSGQVIINGRESSNLKDKETTEIRRYDIGFVYQFHNLLAEFTALENVALPQLITGKSKAASNERAADLLERFGLADRMTHRPAELSGGEQQRVAIARALANKPKLLLADEPTGNLDPKTSDSVFEALLEVTRSENVAALIATHNLHLAGKMDRLLLIQNGKLREGADIAKEHVSF
ncbi:MAG: ABC transporter ATP-binding protein [Parvibaculaceae bacterium]|nr:ABC transporter ATP-binding protein [Parvibaculaceae bacterium]